MKRPNQYSIPLNCEKGASYHPQDLNTKYAEDLNTYIDYLESEKQEVLNTFVDLLMANPIHDGYHEKKIKALQLIKMITE